MKEKISIIIPVYNEEKTLRKVINKIIALDLNTDKEIIIVDDGSEDKTKAILLKLKGKNHKIKIYFHKTNSGKGSAIRTGLKNVKGSIITIQDADLEYDVNNLKELIKPILEEEFDVVYGSRFMKENEKGKFLFYLGNNFLSLVTSILYSQKITDMETCYKLFRKDILKGIKLECMGFEFEPEITSKILRKGHHIKEIPIDYFPRSRSEGKKIKMKDGLIALMCLIKYKFFQ